MAYFLDDGECFEEQCSRCKYGSDCCPIAFVQGEYNYDACNNKVCANILNCLVNNNGECAMFDMCKDDFRIKEKWLLND